MSRAAAIVLLCFGASLIVTWLAGPASSEPQAPVARPAEAAAPSSTPLDLVPLRLPEPAPAASFEPPTRDPFAYGVGPAAAVLAPPVASDWTDAIPPTPRVPALVAILAQPAAAGGGYRAAVRSATGEIRLVAPGDAIDGAVVEDVGAATIVFRDVPTGTLTRVPLRQP